MPFLESVNSKHSHSLVLIGHTIVTFSLGLYTVFQPLYFYYLGVPIIWIIGFELLYWFFSFLLVLPIFYTIVKIGIKNSLVIGWIFRIFLLITLATLSYLIDTHSLFVAFLLIGVFQRLANSYYWYPFHSIFAIVTDGSNEGKSLGYLLAFSRIATILSPAVGGLLLVLLPYEVFFTLMCTIFTLGVCFYLFVVLPKGINLSFNTVELIKKGLDTKNLPFFTEGIIGMAQDFVWPLLLGLRNVNLIVLGSLFMFTNFSRTMVYVIIGNVVDKNRNWIRFIQGIGMATMSISFFVRSIFLNLFFASSGQALGGIGQTVYSMPTIANMYLEASPKNFIIPIVCREFALNLGRFTLSAVAYVTVLLYQDVIGLTATLVLVSIWCASLAFVYSFFK